MLTDKERLLRQDADILACCRKVDYCYAWIKSSGTKLKPVLLYKK